MLLKHPTRYRAAPQQTIIWSKVPVVLGAGPCFTGSLDICGGAIPACPYTHFITFFFLQSCLRYFYMNLSLRMNFKVRFPSSMKTLSRAWLELHCFCTKWELVAKWDWDFLWCTQWSHHLFPEWWRELPLTLSGTSDFSVRITCSFSLTSNSDFLYLVNFSNFFMDFAQLVLSFQIY